MNVYAYADIVRATTARIEAAHVASLARVRAEIAADDQARADRETALRRAARRSAASKVVRTFRSTLARFEREAPNTTEATDVLRRATRIDTTLRNGGEADGIAAITGEMLRLMP